VNKLVIVVLLQSCENGCNCDVVHYCLHVSVSCFHRFCILEVLGGLGGNVESACQFSAHLGFYYKKALYKFTVIIIIITARNVRTVRLRVAYSDDVSVSSGAGSPGL